MLRKIFPNGQASLLFDVHTLNKEVGCVKTNTMPVVHCEYSEEGKSLPLLLEEAFRLYLARILAMDKYAAPCGR